jgi:membrane protein
MNVVDRVDTALQRWVATARQRSGAFDHLCRAYIRYDDVLGGRLAAAIAYYGFFAVFAILLIGYWVFGLLLRYKVDLLGVVREFLTENLPFLDVQMIQQSGQTIGVVGLVGLALTGIGWIEAIRSSQRHIWEVNQQPGNWLIRRVLDLAVLIGVLLLVSVSWGAAYGVEVLLSWLSKGQTPILLTVVSWALTILVNMLFAAALLVAVPRLQMTVSRALPSVVLVGLGITLLNTVGVNFVRLVERNPAYALVGSAVGLLVYLYLFNQLLLFGAAWAATSRHGRVRDFSGTGDPGTDVAPPAPPGVP